MQKDLQQQIKDMHDAQFEANMQLITLVGNLSHWRTNFKNNAAKGKILVGHQKIFTLLDRFKCRSK